MSELSDDRGAELRELFFETSQELLQSLNDEALKLEKQPGDGEIVRCIRRIVHTLKGDAAASGFRELSDLAHRLEDALALESAGAHSSLPEIVFSAADVFTAMVASYRQQTKLPATAALKKLVRELARDPQTRKARSPKSPPPVSEPIAWTEYEKLAMQGAADQGQSVYHIRVQIDPDCAMPIAARQLALKALGEVGKILGSRPEAASAEVSKRFEILLASRKTAEQLTVKCRIPTVVSQARVEPIELQPRQASSENIPAAGLAPATASAAESEAAADPGREAETLAKPPAQEDDNSGKSAAAPAENILRVDAERIDTVLNLVGELIIGKSMLQQAVNEFSRHYPMESMRGRLADAMAFQARVLSDLQHSVMKVRMVPVEQLYRRFPRMVRDVAKQCGKDVQLVLSGQETDLDKGILDAIAEPLTHLVRNAVGHGIEKPEDRIRAAKPAQGTIRLDAYHQGNQVVVEINDDGHGIDAQKVKMRAVERGVLSAEEAGRLSESEVLQLIFRPGFSTADEITEISGRGVGLDIVQSVLQKLKGTVQVETRHGQGTTFRLRLPLTLAIIKALLFRVEQRLYAIALNSVAEIARAQESNLHQVDGREVLQLRNQVLPVIRLGRGPAALESREGRIFVLVIEVGERKFGLLVNALEGEEELVIKALDNQTVATDLVSGASILGDGRVVLILNLMAVVDRFARSRGDTDSGAAYGMLLSYSERTQGPQNTPGVCP